jgi:NADPH2 dehydrogenase
MSALFSPIKLRGLALANRIMVAPMCQYSAENGEANDWHFTHINTLALSGAAMFCIEATHVEAIGRITPGCLGLWNDATEAALKPILASVRKHSKAAVAMQIAHAGRKGSSHVPWNGGQLIPISEGGWQTVAPSAVPHKEGETAPLVLDAAGLARIRDAFVSAAKRADRLGIDALEVHGARLSVAPVPVADFQQPHRPIWRLLAKPHALSARSVRRDPRGISGGQADRRQSVGDRLGRGRLGPGADD